jgi:acetylornithine deacetylase/succinyl-diaminopimelate desuccinylase-like protein
MSDLVERIREVMPSVRRDLEDLVRIESVWADPARRTEVQRSAEAVAKLLSEAGFGDVQIVSEGGAPAVIARHPAPPGAPTVLLYAHHDVQPEGDHGQWQSPPFEPTERDGRLYGRGSADDKAGIATHLAAFRAHDGAPPVGVTVFVEGEEESGSPSLSRLLAAHRDVLASDVIVIADSDNWSTDVPSLTVSLRGLADCIVEVATLDHGLHSGIWGGVAPDALSVLVRLLASLHDDDGNVAVAGLHEGTAADVEYSPERVREEAGLLDGVSEIGSGSVPQRLWAKPAITVIGIDTTSIDKSSNTLIPRARAKVSMRVAPGGDPREHLAVGCAGDHYPRRHRPAVRNQRKRAGLRRGPRRVSQGVGQRTRRDRGWWFDPVHRRVRGGVPVGEDLGHRRGGPADAGAQHQRKPAPGRAGTRCDGRGAAVGEPGRRSLATWPVARTLYCASAILPFSSTTNVERITPLWCLSTCTYASSNNSIYLRQSKDSRGNKLAIDRRRTGCLKLW